MKRDPIIRTRKYLESKKAWDDKQQKAIEDKAKVIVQEVMKTSLEFGKSPVDSIFDFMYADLPAELTKQKDTLKTHSIGQNPEQVGLKTQHQEA